MRLVNKKELEELMEKNPNGGVVFSEYRPHVMASDIMITDGDFGATCLVPYQGEVFDFDWNIKEYSTTDEFYVFNQNDILQMIQNLTKGLKISLEYDGPFSM